MLTHPRHRRCVVLRGAPEQTSSRAVDLLAACAPESVLWVDERPAPGGFEHVAPQRAHGLLGRSFDAVVVSMHLDIDANVLGQCQGFVWGGGALVLRLPPAGVAPTNAHERMMVPPYSAADVRLRFFGWLVAHLPADEGSATSAVAPAVHAIEGSGEQRGLVERLRGRLDGPGPSYTAVLADRGRGKSAALGLVIRELLQRRPSRVAVSGASEEATREVLRFARLDQPAPPGVTPPSVTHVAFTPLMELVHGDAPYDVIVVDEAAQVPVPVLQRLVRRRPQAHFLFATTSRGYEGTGRGFTLRFLHWLRHQGKQHHGKQHQGRQLHEHTLHEPIRWAEHDPLESTLFRALLLDAEMSEVHPNEIRAHRADIVHRELDRDELLARPELLRAFFGLLVQAHYRTTPEDLRRILDAPNIRLHALLWGDAVVAATMVALEGQLSAQVSDDLYWGRTRIRGHALPETLCSHAGHPEAGPMQMVRSVRIAVPPALRRLGLASQLVDAIHRHYQPDLFGTLFGATEGLVQFRRNVGYALVRVGASRGTRTGEPSVVMIRPVSARAQELVAALRAELARELPVQLDLLTAGHELELDESLRAELLDDAAQPAPLDEAQIAEAARVFAFGPRTHEAVAVALRMHAMHHAAARRALPAPAQTLIETRIVQGASWEQTRRAAQLTTIPSTMRATKRAYRELLEQLGESDPR